MPSPGAWPYSASETPLTAHGTGNADLNILIKVSMKMHKVFKSSQLQVQLVTFSITSLMFPAKYSEQKSSWPPEPIGHGKSWRTNRNPSHLPRPPPGLSSQKQPWSGEGPWMPRTWGGGASPLESPFKTGTANTLSHSHM